MAIRELWAVFGFDWDRPALAALDSKVDAAFAKVKRLSSAFVGASQSAKAAAAPMQALASAAAAAPAGRGLAGLAAQAKAAGVGVAGLRGALAGLQGRVRAAAEGDQVLSSAFQRLGVDIDRVANSGRSSLSVWNEMIGRLSKVKSAAEQADLAVAALGEEGAKIAMPAIKAGPQQLRIQRRLEAVVAPAPVPAPTPAALSRWAAFSQRIRQAGQWYQLHIGTMPRQLNQTAQAANQAARGVQQFGNETRRAGQSVTSGMLQASFWQGLGRSIIAVGRAAATTVAGIAQRAGETVVETSIWAERSMKALSMISGGRKGFFGEAEFDDAAQAAAKLGLEVRTTVDSYQKLRGVGFRKEQALDLVKLTADMKAGLGLSNEVVGRVQLALGQIKGAGKLQGDELRQLQETGLNIDLVWQSIAEQLDTTVPKAMKLKEQGKVGADIAIQAVKDAVLGTLGTKESGEAAAVLARTTLAGMISRAKGAADLWLIDLAKRITPRLNTLAGKIGETFEKLEKSGKLKKFLTSLETLAFGVVDKIVAKWPDIERIIVKVVDGSNEGLGRLIANLDKLLNIFLIVVEGIVDNWEDIQTTIIVGAAAVALAITGIGAASVVSAITGVISAIGTIGTAIFGASAATGAASTAMVGALGTVAAAAAATTLMIAGVGAAAYNAAKLVKESAPEGGVWNAWMKAGGLEGFGTFLATGEAKNIGGKAFIRGPNGEKIYDTGEKMTARERIRAGAPVDVPRTFGGVGGFGGFGVVAPPTRSMATTPNEKRVIVNDTSTQTINVTAPSPAEAAKRVSAAVVTQGANRMNAMLAAVAGASNG